MLLKNRSQIMQPWRWPWKLEFRHMVQAVPALGRGFSLCVVHEKPVLFMKSQVRPG